MTFRLAISVAVVATLAAPVHKPAMAQDENTAEDPDNLGLEVIVVTAQKREQSLEEVPISIRAYSAEEIDKLQIDTVTDVAILTPSVAVNDGLNPLFTAITIRGIGDIGGDQATSGIYLDGFELSANSSAGLGIEFSDIERIEVLRGPQGTTFGRNVIAGAISITTKAVADSFGGYLEGSVENFDGYGLKGAVDLPLVANVFGMRAAGFYRSSDGNIENIGLAGGSNDYERFGGRITFDAEFSERLSMKAALGYDKLDQGLQNFIGDGFLDSSLLPLADIIDAGLNPRLPPGSIPAGPDRRFPQQNDTVEFNTPTSFDFETLVTTVRFDYDLGDMQFVWVSGYIDNTLNRFEDTDLSNLDAIILDQANDSDFSSTELRLQSSGDNQLDWVIGAYAADAEATATSSIGSGTEASSVYFLPGGVPLPIAPDGSLVVLPFDLEVFPNNLELFSTNARSKERSYALFAEAEYDLSDSVSVFAGARFNHDDIEEQTFDPVTLVSLNALLSPAFTEAAPLSPLQTSLQGTALGEIVLWPAAFADAQDDGDFEKTTWRLGAKWRPAEDINLYGTVSVGYRPGGLQLAGGLVPPTFGSEELTNYEVGMKSFLFDRMVSVNAALFHMDWQDVQIATRAPGATFSFTDNVGEAQVRGIEVDFLARFSNSLTLGAAFAYLDTEIEDFIDSDGFDRSGSELPNSAEFSGNAFIDYESNLLAGLDGFARISYIYTGEQLADFITGGIDRPPLESWERVDLRLGIAAPDNWRLEFYAENLFDEIYATGKDAVGFGLSGQYVVSPPQRFGVRFTMSF